MLTRCSRRALAALGLASLVLLGACGSQASGSAAAPVQVGVAASTAVRSVDNLCSRVSGQEVARALGAPSGSDSVPQAAVDGLLRCKWLIGLRESDRQVEFIAYVGEPGWVVGSEPDAFSSMVRLLDMSGDPQADPGVGLRSAFVEKSGSTNIRYRLAVELDDGQVLGLQGGDDALEGRDAEAVLAALAEGVLLPALELPRPAP